MREKQKQNLEAQFTAVVAVKEEEEEDGSEEEDAEAAEVTLFLKYSLASLKSSLKKCCSFFPSCGRTFLVPMM